MPFEFSLVATKENGERKEEGLGNSTSARRHTDSSHNRGHLLLCFRQVHRRGGYCCAAGHNCVTQGAKTAAMPSVDHLKQFVSDRLAAAAEEIMTVFHKTIVEYEAEMDRHRKLLDVVRMQDLKLCVVGESVDGHRRFR